MSAIEVVKIYAKHLTPANELINIKGQLKNDKRKLLLMWLIRCQLCTSRYPGDTKALKTLCLRGKPGCLLQEESGTNSQLFVQIQ